MRTGFHALVAVLLGLTLAGCGSFSDDEANTSNLRGKKMTVYYSPSCSCCKDYVSYLREQGVDVKTVRRNRSGMARVKSRLGVSRSAASCHTGVIEDYVVEGHVPAQVVAKLLEERPDGVTGVTIPGMPRYAPGMGGPIGEPLSVFSIEPDGRAGDVYGTVEY